MRKVPNLYQKQFFFASIGHYPQTDIELQFASGVLPVSPEDASWRHTTSSAEYASRVVIALEQGDVPKANQHVQVFRDESEQTRGFGKEALAKLQALGIIIELYEGDVLDPGRLELEKIHTILEQIRITPRPEFQ